VVAIFGGGLPACHPAQPSSNSIEYFPDLRLMETDLFAAATALERHAAADPPGCRATLVSAIWAANDFYLAGIERARRHRTALSMSLHLPPSIAPHNFDRLMKLARRKGAACWPLQQALSYQSLGHFWRYGVFVRAR